MAASRRRGRRPVGGRRQAAGGRRVEGGLKCVCDAATKDEERERWEET